MELIVLDVKVGNGRHSLDEIKVRAVGTESHESPRSDLNREKRGRQERKKRIDDENAVNVGLSKERAGISQAQRKFAIRHRRIMCNMAVVARHLEAVDSSDD